MEKANKYNLISYLFIHVIKLYINTIMDFFMFFYCFRLDRKSSRGMVYENEELRLRTININAEVERGELKYINHKNKL